MADSQSEDWGVLITHHLNAGGRGRWLERIRVKERDGGRGAGGPQRSVSQTLAQSSVVSWARG